MRGKLFIVVSFGLVLATNALAQSLEDNEDRCANAADPDLTIGACTAIIQSGNESNTGLADAFNDRGAAYDAKGQLNRALEDYNQAIHLDPADAHAYFNRGQVYLEAGDFGRAIADETQALRLDPNDARPYYVRGIAKQKTGDTAGGDADIAAARKINPNIGQ